MIRKERIIKEKIDDKENQHIMLITFLLILPFLLGSLVYLIHLRSINVIESDTSLVLHAFALGLIFIIICLGIYEVLYGWKVKGPFAFHFKRFLVHAFVFAGFWIFTIIWWVILDFFLLAFISWKYNLLISLYLAIFMLAIIIRTPKIKNFLNKLDKGG